MKIKINNKVKTLDGKVLKTTQALLLPKLLANYQAMEKGNPLKYAWILLVGGRLSAKTYNVLFVFCLMLLIKNKKIIAYFVRLNDRMLKETRNDLFNHFEQLGINITYGAGGNYNANDNTLTLGKNKVYFKTLNHEKIKITSGGIAGLTSHNDADYIIVFFDEVTALNEKLVSQFLQSVRGGPQTQKMIVMAANPWSPMNWFIKEVNEYLPENEKELEEKGYQEIEFFHPHKKVNYYVLRNNIQTNQYITPATYNNLKAEKEKDINWYKIIFLGMAGTIGNVIYAHNMKHCKKVDYNWINSDEGFFQGGVDWGDGSSVGSSPSTAHFGKINLNNPKFSVVDELTLWNNKVEVKRTTKEQIKIIVDFFVNQWYKYKKPFQVFVDNASLSDFYQMFNADIAERYGEQFLYNVEFRPAWKPPKQKRINVINLMLARGWIEIDDKCKDLITALHNAHWVERKEENAAEFERKRNHAEEHWLNSGVEYILDHYLDDFAQMVDYKLKK